MQEDQIQARALALVGMPGSGKTLCAEHLEKQGYFQLRFGGIIVGEVERRGLEINPENERIVREEFRARDGMAAIAKAALPQLKLALENHSHIIIDGLYSFSEYKVLSRELGVPMVVVAIVAPRALRYQRLAARKIRPLTLEEAEQRDIQEIERLEKGGPIAIADYTLTNAKKPNKLLKKLDRLLEGLGFVPST